MINGAVGDSALLTVMPNWVGDAVMAHSLLIRLAQKYPGTPIDLLAPEQTAPLGAFMPEVRKVWISPFKHGELGIGARRRLADKLKDENYSLAIILPNSFKSALIPFFAKIPQRRGWRGEWRGLLLNDMRIAKVNMPSPRRMVEQFSLLAEEIQDGVYPVTYPRFQTDELMRKEVLAQFRLKTEPKVLALCPGAEYGEAKRWPVEYFSAVAQKWISEDGQVWLLGVKNEHGLCAQIQAQCPKNCFNLAGKTTLSQAILLLSASAIVITNDSGLMHLAAALDKPLVALYGSTSPKWTPPLNKKNRVLYLSLSCSPCFKRKCPLKHQDCLKNIHPEQAIKALKELA